MRSFSYTIQNAAGLHARPVAQVAAAALEWESAISVTCAGRSADARDLMELMALDASCGDELHVEVEGADEEAAAEALQAIFTF